MDAATRRASPGTAGCERPAGRPHPVHCALSEATVTESVGAPSGSTEKAKALAAAGAQPILVDVFDAQALQRAVVDARPAVVLHELTDLPAGLDHARMPEAIARNARMRSEGTANLVAAALAAGVVLRYGHLCGPGTGADVATAPPALHIDAAAWATALALERAEPGIYNIADPSAHLNTGKARTKLDWSADCGPLVIPGPTS